MAKKIFFPKCCTRAPPGILIGCESQDGSINVIATIQFPVTARSLNSYLAKYNDGIGDNEQHGKIGPMGIWFPINSDGKDEDNCKLLQRLFQRNKWITLTAVKNELQGSGDIKFNIELYVQGESGDAGRQYSKVPLDSLIIIYDQKEIWEMEFSPESVLGSEGALKGLFQTILCCKNGFLTYEAGMSSEEEGIKITHCCVEREVSLVFHLLKVLTVLFFGVIFLALSLTRRVCTSYFTRLAPLLKMASEALKLSSFCGHALQRFSDLFNSIFTLYTPGQLPHKKHKDVIASFCMDAAFGTMMLFAMYYLELFPERTTKEVFLPYAESIAGQVEDLIKWLMGIPAGLKLNHPLNQFLGHFFLYHVRLWLEYVRMMTNLFPHLMIYCLFSSCLGLSFFLSVISDAVSTLSFHIYCFYVYAGRLYGLQVTGLMSLWRLFRGKKWNPLRKRVDSLEESSQRADQLFLGTLLFAVLLFLLPTTALYYGIFTLLRVAVLLIQVRSVEPPGQVLLHSLHASHDDATSSWISFRLQVIFGGLVFIFSKFPWYTAALRFFSPVKFTNTVRCDWISGCDHHEAITHEQTKVIQHGDDEAIALCISLQSQPYLNAVISGFHQTSHRPITSIGLKILFGKILSGDLIRWTG